MKRGKWPEQKWPGSIRIAWRIHRDPDLEQDINVRCPVSADGMRCQWVAGHYGGCVLA